MDARLRLMVLLLIRRWHWLAAVATLAAGAAMASIALQPPVYTASVDIVPKRARTEVSFDTRIRTLSAESGAQTTNAPGAPALAAISAERRQALAQLVRNPDVERAVREELGHTLPADLRAPGRLLRAVRATMIPRSEIITISVEAAEPALAEQITATWARAYGQKVNQLYATSGTGSMALDGELLEAKRKYEAAEQALTTFQGTSMLDEYSRQLETKRQALQVMLKELTQTKVQRLTFLHGATSRVDALLGDLQALREQLSAAPDSSAASSNALALTFIKMQAFASSAPLPGGLQVQIQNGAPQATIQQQRADVAATIVALDEWRTRLHQEYRARLLELQLSEVSTPDEVRLALEARLSGAGADALAQMLNDSADPELRGALQEAEQAIRDIQAKVAELSARKKIVQLERDVAWESYTSILKKAEETRVAATVGAGAEVSVASVAVIAERKSRGLVTATALAAVAGAALAGGWILLSFWLSALTPLSGRPQDAQRPATVPSLHTAEEFAGG